MREVHGVEVGDLPSHTSTRYQNQAKPEASFVSPSTTVCAISEYVCEGA
jgi:hypothetical protein